MHTTAPHALQTSLRELSFMYAARAWHPGMSRTRIMVERRESRVRIVVSWAGKASKLNESPQSWILRLRAALLVF